MHTDSGRPQASRIKSELRLGGCYFRSEVLPGEHIGLEEVADGIWSLFFYDVLLGRFHERDWQVLG